GGEGTVPGHDPGGGRQADARGAPGQPGEEGHVVGAGRVVGEVMLGRPDLVVAERLGQLGQPHLVTHHVDVAAAALVVLEDEQDTDFHLLTSLASGSLPAPAFPGAGPYFRRVPPLTSLAPGSLRSSP